MFQPHSFLWHYLWVGPDILLAVLVILAWRRDCTNSLPLSSSMLVYESVHGLTLWVLDILPAVSDDAYWYSCIAGLIIESIIKLAVIREMCSHRLASSPRVERRGNWLMVPVGGLLVGVTILTAAHVRVSRYAIVSRANTLAQSIYLVEAGLLLFIFSLPARYRLVLSRQSFGIAFGASLLAWALARPRCTRAGSASRKIYLADFIKCGLVSGVRAYLVLLSASATVAWS